MDVALSESRPLLEGLAELHLPLERPLRAPDGSVDNAGYRKDTSNDSTHSCQERRKRLALLLLNHQHWRDIKVKEHTCKTNKQRKRMIRIAEIARVRHKKRIVVVSRAIWGIGYLASRWAA